MPTALSDISGTPADPPPPSSLDINICDFLASATLTHELQGQKFSTDTDMKKSTATTLGKKWPTAHVWEVNGALQKIVYKACEGHYFEKQTVPRHQESSVSNGGILFTFQTPFVLSAYKITLDHTTTSAYSYSVWCMVTSTDPNR
jgi:hypothetical protein